jgi:ATP synthase protein I
MPSNDARTLVHIAVPTAAVGAIAVVVSAALAGGKGALGAVIGTALVIVLMGLGLVALERTAKSLPHLFQMMGLLLYAAQLLLMVVFIALFKDATFFNPKAFAFTLLATTLVWIAAQTRAHMKAKILYVEPESEKGDKPQNSGSKS